MAFFKQSGNKVLFNEDGELLYYIPEKYFGLNCAIVNGEYIDTIGVFTYEVFDKSGKSKVQKLMKCPTFITCKPSEISKQSLKLKGTKAELPYRVLKFKKDDELICSTDIPQDINNVEIFINLYSRGNLPRTTPYDQVYDLIDKNAKLNGFNYKVPAQMIGIVMGELFRNPDDKSDPFRLAENKSMTDYEPISINNSPKYVSPFASITSENADEAIANAITIKNYKDSPLERVMML